jgi:hypothetical protein
MKLFIELNSSSHSDQHLNLTHARSSHRKVSSGNCFLFLIEFVLFIARKCEQILMIRSFLFSRKSLEFIGVSFN